MENKDIKNIFSISIIACGVMGGYKLGKEFANTILPVDTNIAMKAIAHITSRMIGTIVGCTCSCITASFAEGLLNNSYSTEKKIGDNKNEDK